jgi:hypothetical protein
MISESASGSLGRLDGFDGSSGASCTHIGCYALMRQTPDPPEGRSRFALRQLHLAFVPTGAATPAVISSRLRRRVSASGWADSAFTYILLGEPTRNVLLVGSSAEPASSSPGRVLRLALLGSVAPAPRGPSLLLLRRLSSQSGNSSPPQLLRCRFGTPHRRCLPEIQPLSISRRRMIGL